jgi:hypothetical protein
MKRTVFISSTFEDLKDYRKKVWEKLSEYEVNIRGMERFGARPEAPLKTCLAEVEQSDIFIGIIGYRLGTVDNISSKSYVQLEYDKAYELEKEIFIYFIDEKKGKINPISIDFGENHDKLEAFKSILKERHTIDTFEDEKDLIEKLGRKFEELLSKKDNEKPNKIIDEYSKSQEILNKFLLLPKTYSGKEVKLRMKVDGYPFPASKAICKSFYLDYGRTIGVRIKLILPNISEETFDYLFLGSKYAEKILAIGKDEEVEIYASPQFTEDIIDNIKAHFVSKTYTSFKLNPVINSINGSSEPFTQETQTIQAEGQIILQLKDFIT